MNAPNPNWFLRARLKTRQLLLLIALDDEGTLMRAAEVLCMTQPAASKQLKELEDMLGIALFERLPRGMEPTIYGESMIRHARMALTSLARAHEDIVALRAGLAGQVDVGSIMTPAMRLLPCAITRVKKLAPLLRIGVQVESSMVLLERLQRGNFDFLLARMTGLSDNADLQYEELAAEPVVVVARVGHPLAGRARLSLHELAGAPWIMPPPGSILRQRFDQQFHNAGLEPPGDVVDTSEIVLITSMLQMSDALNVMSADIALHYQELGLLAVLPIELACQMDPYGIIRRRDRLLSPGAELLLQAIRRQASTSLAVFDMADA
ncbi:LysR family transcriptional regulator [Duganella violaceipulchra]|uniref:DNA-binding transcriptional LysR family regulator n=1 Tax=Duganella violaceipulchra TaxID=2849652 RepID=A0AA41H6T6_9BURK|nr:LysR family transcriptional regulator [Duganella violaceicalia]MBV6323062.1 LysR family transcriptional regulator [Duganella violaceicalia]MCP2010152.1 DNA-binding transcriptional LysR family regulator [Duganella violaceicalia]